MEGAEKLLERLEGVQQRHGYAQALCPVHGDQKASLTVGKGTSQPVVIHCHAGCAPEDVLAKVGLTWDDLCVPREAQDRPDVTGRDWTPRGPAVDVYDYRDEDRRLLYQVCRTADKQFPCRVPDESRKSGFRWTLGNARRVLYRLPELIDAVADGQVVYVCEGEKDVKAILAQGMAATCNPGGAGKWRDEYAEFFRGAIVEIVADKDKPGQAHARRIMSSLTGVAAGVEICEPAGNCKDISDHLSAGYTLAELDVTCTGEDYESDLEPDLYQFLDVVEPPQCWVIPYMIERGDRLLWTGYEGLGKSYVVRQLAVCAAAGIHPFTGEEFPPQRVLYIDCENPDRISRRSFRRLERVARVKGRPVGAGMLRIIQRPAGLDLSREEDAAWLCERVTAHQPDLLTIGPFYRLHSSDTNDEGNARQVVSALDTARLKSGCALITEHHPGHGDPGNRSLRPTGSSLLMRWPELGYGIKHCGDADEGGHYREVSVVSWRPPRDERHWPKKLAWGSDSDWPWITGVEVPAAMNGHGRVKVTAGWSPEDEEKRWPT